MRAFVALDLPEGLAAALTRLQAGLGVGKAVPEENLHLTLAFLGDVPDAALDELAADLATLRLPPIALRLNGLDLFGGRRPSVLFARAEAEGLGHLHDKVVRVARAAGLKLRRERFRPHVTLARLPKAMTPHESRRLSEFLALNATFTAGPEPAAGLSLYASHLHHEGAHHVPLASFALTG